MTTKRSAYELSESQVTTPETIVTLFWRLTRERRQDLDRVLDLGAGDCRFGQEGSFHRYVGVEIDRSRSYGAKLPQNGRLIHNCVFRHRDSGYDACVGNPPYVRHHEIDTPWKQLAVDRFKRELGISFAQHCNLYLYFLALALVKTHNNGLVALVIPYEWVSRPSAKPLRNYIRKQRWNVAVYRFQKPIFKDVLTTASVTIIDKSKRERRWTYFDVTSDLKVIPRKGITESPSGVLPYTNGDEAWALRGLSPGTQKVFTLTEIERLAAGLRATDVVPCVTTLRNVPRSLKVLSKASFKKHFVRAGAKCWLIKSDCGKVGSRLQAYLNGVRRSDRDTYTCHHQKPWYKFTAHPVPQLLVGSGFTKFGPKVIINGVGARAVGSVWGIHSTHRLPKRNLQRHLVRINIEKRVVAHAKILKKIEVKQLNTIVNRFMAKQPQYGRNRTK